MLHWNSWWTPSPHAPSDDRPPPANDLIGLQAHFWERWLDAHRSWWAMYAANLPMLPWPPAGVLAPPESVLPQTEPESQSKPQSNPKASPASRAVRRVQPVASGPAGAKLKRQRKR